jgi:hypothetical protein
MPLRPLGCSVPRFLPPDVEPLGGKTWIRKHVLFGSLLRQSERLRDLCAEVCVLRGCVAYSGVWTSHGTDLVGQPAKMVRCEARTAWQCERAGANPNATLPLGLNNLCWATQTPFRVQRAKQRSNISGLAIYRELMPHSLFNFQSPVLSLLRGCVFWLTP